MKCTNPLGIIFSSIISEISGRARSTSTILPWYTYYDQHSIPELDEKVKRVERVSYLRSSEDIEKQEDAQLPAITEECALWLKQYELSKILDSDIRHFLDIKKVRLSERSFKVLKNAVIFKHRTS